MSSLIPDGYPLPYFVVLTRGVSCLHNVTWFLLASTKTAKKTRGHSGEASKYSFTILCRLPPSAPATVHTRFSIEVALFPVSGNGCYIPHTRQKTRPHRQPQQSIAVAHPQSTTSYPNRHANAASPPHTPLVK